MPETETLYVGKLLSTPSVSQSIGQSTTDISRRLFFFSGVIAAVSRARPEEGSAQNKYCCPSSLYGERSKRGFSKSRLSTALPQNICTVSLTEEKLMVDSSSPKKPSAGGQGLFDANLMYTLPSVTIAGTETAADRNPL